MVSPADLRTLAVPLRLEFSQRVTADTLTTARPDSGRDDECDEQQDRSAQQHRSSKGKISRRTPPSAAAPCRVSALIPEKWKEASKKGRCAMKLTRPRERTEAEHNTSMQPRRTRCVIALEGLCEMLFFCAATTSDFPCEEEHSLAQRRSGFLLWGFWLMSPSLACLVVCFYDRLRACPLR